MTEPGGAALRIESTRRLSPDAVRLFEEADWGTGGVRMVMGHVARDLSAFPQARYYSLFEGEQLCAVLTARELKRNVDGNLVPAVYLSPLVVAPEKQNAGYGSHLLQKVMEEPGLLPGGDSFFFTHVEVGNAPSLHLFQKAGFKSFGNFLPLMYSRFRPNKSVRLDTIREDEKPIFREELRQFYKNYNFTDFEESLDILPLYVLRAEGDIRAAIQAKPIHWSFEKLPGAKGFALSRILPKVPGGKRLFNARDFRALKFYAAYFQEGAEDDLLELMEGLLERFTLNSGLLYVDRTSPLCQALQKRGRFGLMSAKAKAGIEMLAFAPTHTAPSGLWESGSPFYISPFTHL